MSCGGCRPTRRIRAGAALPRPCRTSPIAAAPPACGACSKTCWRDGDWDGIVFDGISAGWALPRRARALCRPPRPPAAHLRLAQPRGQPAQPDRREPAMFLKRQAVRLDALKVSRLERELVDAVDFVTAITPGGPASSIASARGDKPMDVLTPGYCGRRVDERRISPDAAAPRRHRRQLRLDRQAHEPGGVRRRRRSAVRRGRRRAAGRRQRRRGLPRSSSASTFVATSFTGTVPDVSAATSTRRASRSCPSATAAASSSRCWSMSSTACRSSRLTGSFAGVPLRHDDSAMLFSDHAALAHGVLEAIDDVDRLNRLQERAFAACRDQLRLVEPRPADPLGDRRAMTAAADAAAGSLDRHRPASISRWS